MLALLGFAQSHASTLEKEAGRLCHLAGNSAPKWTRYAPKKYWSGHGKARAQTILCNQKSYAKTHVAAIDTEKASRTPMCCWCQRAFPFRLQRVDILKHLTNDEKAHRKMCESEQMNNLYMPRDLHVYPDPCVGMCVNASFIIDESPTLVEMKRISTLLGTASRYCTARSVGTSPTPGTACLCPCRAVALVCCF